MVVAGHRGDSGVAERHLDDPDASVRVAALAALQRVGVLTDQQITAAFVDVDVAVRRRAAELAATRPGLDLTPLLSDDDPTVVEDRGVGVWRTGDRCRRCPRRTDRSDRRRRRTSSFARRGAAALGAIGDTRGAPAIIAACADKPHVRRRAVLALAPFDGNDVEAAIDRALDDRDWQVRQAAEDLRRAAEPVDGV